jgi:hypothetical protein
VPLLLYSRCPKLVQIPGLGTGTRLSHAQTSQIADSERIFSLAYCFTVGTSGNAVYLIFQKPPFCNGPETELKYEIGVRENIPLVFYHIQTVGS